MILAPFLIPLCASACAPVSRAGEPSGHYVEARTASVFAGACHYGGERTTAGREALLAWSFDARNVDERYVDTHDASARDASARDGSARAVRARDVGASDVDTHDIRAPRSAAVAGLCVAALVSDDLNLEDAPRARRSVVYVPESATPSQRAALVAWLRSSASSTLGEIVAVKPVALTVVVGPESFAARASGVFDLAGDSLPDHACCKMPYQVWYEPFVALGHRLVGHDTRFEVDERALGLAWSRPGENAAFFGTFGADTGTRSAQVAAADRLR